jgi:hypothetical protein
MGDTAVMLSYKDLRCLGIECICPCSLSLVYEHGPFSAGKYSIWETVCFRSPSCLLGDTIFCTDSSSTVQKIGDFTVRLPSAVKFETQSKVPALAKQTGPVKLFDLFGRGVTQISNRKFGVYIATYGRGNLVKKLMVGD